MKWFKKWELVEDGVRMKKVEWNPFTGYLWDGYIFCDVHRKKKRNGTYKYKTIER